ncbi:MAG: I78 family peptidase inhibitor [Pseudomonadota bacterium]
MAIRSCAIGLMSLSAAGCATVTDEPPMAGAGSCDADASQALVGQMANQDLAAMAMRQSGAGVLRWIPPDSAVTMDFREDRLNISYDRGLIVTAIRCG